MTSTHPLIEAFKHVRFGIGTASKRFARDMVSARPDWEFSAKQEAFAWRIAYHYRRQLPKALADEAVDRWNSNNRYRKGAPE